MLMMWQYPNSSAGGAHYRGTEENMHPALREKEQETQEENHLMEEKKKKKQEEKKKKEAAHKKAAEQKTKVPVSAKLISSPPHPANRSVTPPIPTVSSSGNGKRAPPSAQQQLPAAPRFPLREVPPRFRQQEHKQLLKRGQPLPAGTLVTTGQPGASSPPQTPPASPSKQHAEFPHQSGLGAQYENLHCGHRPSNCIWDQVIVDRSDTEEWPSISYSESHAPSECTTDIDCTTEISSSNMSMATGAGQQSHFSAHHPSSKNSGNHSGNMVSNQGGASRGWGSGPTHGSSAIGSDGKTDSMPMGGRGQPCWGSSNFNLNLNPSANPAAWPVLGHEGAGMGSGGPGGNKSPPPPNLCSPASALSAQGGGGSMGSTNGNPVGGSGNSAWGSMLPPDPTESRPSPSTIVSFSVEPQNLNTDGPNNTKQQPLSPIHSLPSWGSVPVDMGPLVQPQVNGEESSVWGNGDAKPTGSKDSAWNFGPPSGPGILMPWGRGGGNTGAWGRSACSGGGDWGKHSSETKGWETSGSPPQEQSVSWSNAPASEGSNDNLQGISRRMERPHGELDAPLPMGRQDLDPRVLSNTGWGQTPVRQHTAWELEEMARSDHKNDTGVDSWSTGSSSSSSSAPPPAPANTSADPAAAQVSNSGGKGEGSTSNSSAAPGWGNPAQAIATPASSLPCSSWDEAVSKKAPSGSGGWGEPPSGSSNSTAPKGGMSWGQEEKSPSWDDPPAKPKPQSWGEGPKPGHGWGTGASGGGDWGEPREEKKNGVTPASWEQNPRYAGWGKPGQGAGAGVGVGWMEAQRPSVPVQAWGGKPQDNSNSSGSIGSWGGSGTVKQCGTGWGGGGGGGSKQEQGGEPTGWEEPSPPSVRRKVEIDDGTSAWGDPSTYNKTVNLWDKNNSVIQSGPDNAAASNNHGDAAASNNHGDAAASNNHGNAAASNNHGNAAASNNHHHHHHSSHAQNHSQARIHAHSHAPSNTHSSPQEQTTPHQPSAPQNRSVLDGPGWGDSSSSHPKPEPSWGKPVSPAAVVDNGTSAWGKPPGSCGGWEDNPSDPSGSYGRGNPPSGLPPCKPASKSMQDGWGGSPDELGGWDRDEGDVWNSAASQESNSSCNSWGNLPKKGLQKIIRVPSKQDEAWILSRLIKQLTDIGFPREPAEEALKSNSMNLDQAMSALLEKKSELDKRGMGMCDYNGLLSKPLGCRPPAISKESSSDCSPFLDKDGGLVEDAPASPFLPSPSLKFPLSSSALPNQALGGVPSGLAMQNINNRQIQNSMFCNSGAAQFRAMQHQPAVPPLSSSQPSVRAQVPQFLSPQVQAQLLQFAAKNIGLNPALLTSPMNPQHMTLLNQLYQLQLSYQRLQIQQQMLQAQRSVSGPMRQQEQQVARTINNMQQQIQQHQRQLAQALLMKQQPPPHPGLHPGTGKSALDSFPPHLQAPGLPDLQTKEQQCSPNSFSPHPLSGLNPNMNVNSMEVGSGLSMKDSSQSQSRLPQWTHPNSMENLSGTSSPLEQSLSKHGAIPAGPSIGPPGKSPMDDSYIPYNLIPSSESPASPLVAPDNWTQAKSANDKICNGTNINWPPEFCPGVPWKGLQNIDPETDPNVTPGSVPSGPTINTNIQDVNRYLLRDRSEGKPSDMKSTWSPGPISHPQASLSHELWKVPQGPRNLSAPTRPPPGLTNTKPSSTWGGNSLGLTPGWSSSYTSRTTWSTDSSARTSSWLVLRNLTPQIDGSTLRTLCMQHGPLLTFHLNLTQGNAVVRYSSKEEAAKAQKSLHMCVLGNTTILAEFAGEEEVNRFFAQGQSLTPTTSWQAHPGTNQMRLGGAGAGHWNSSGGKGGSELLWGGVPQYSSLWGPPGGEDSRGIVSPTPINTLLPGDLLSGESM
ncbi:trinucleotide repeat-containing gene 6C protein-like isoform X2 [Polyodon spathula]|uniref:trinucleotide repeat-containing gene 6C protein-like isoform X2 n=1 Tax=Polyodon spathula TaxID=7913 RepID=UPI001B7DAD88|nr:trinucleotide repeat-containing gene 6C protein-like isoform X2 [Polyodon spathula]